MEKMLHHVAENNGKKRSTERKVLVLYTFFYD